MMMAANLARSPALFSQMEKKTWIPHILVPTLSSLPIFRREPGNKAIWQPSLEMSELKLAYHRQCWCCSVPFACYFHYTLNQYSVSIGNVSLPGMTGCSLPTFPTHSTPWLHALLSVHLFCLRYLSYRISSQSIHTFTAKLLAKIGIANC